MAKKESKFLKQQRFALIAIGLLVLGVVGYLSFLTIQDQPLGEFVEGEHYQLVENPRRIRGDTIEVMEFFSYGCVHCYNFDSDLNSWVDDKGDTIRFVRMPAVSSDYWRLLGRAYYTMQALEMHERHHTHFFREIHEGRQPFNTVELIKDFFVGAGVSEEDFMSTFNSAEVDAQINTADQMARRLKIAAVPMLVVQGKYLVRTTRGIGPRRMLDVMDHIIENEVAAPSTGG